jgi:uncharacterized protein (DUF2164 family)
VALYNEIINWLHSKRRIINLLIGLSAVVLYEFVRATYRPYIYSQGINDFHIADTIGNSLGTVATIFVFTSLLGKDLAQDYFMIRTVTISVAVYELAHPLLGKPIDPWDLATTIVTGVICEFLYRLIYRRPHIV